MKNPYRVRVGLGIKDSYANDAAFVAAISFVSAGDFYYNSVSNSFRFYNGTLWNTVGIPQGTVTDSTTRWSGTDWIENTAVLINTLGKIHTLDNAVNDAIATNPLSIVTGNKTGVTSTGAGGNIDITGGDSYGAQGSIITIAAGGTTDGTAGTLTLKAGASLGSNNGGIALLQGGRNFSTGDGGEARVYGGLGVVQGNVDINGANIKLGASNQKILEFASLESRWSSQTLNDNTAVAVDIPPFPLAFASNHNIIIDFSIRRQTGATTWAKEMGTIFLTVDEDSASPVVSMTVQSSVIDVHGIDLIAAISGANVSIQYTSTSTGYNANMKFKLRKWND